MGPLELFLQQHAEQGLIPWFVQQAAAEQFSLSLAEVEKAILDQGLLPSRYQRNRQMISLPEQRRLFASRVAVVGAGGLGGYVIEQLARLGVGRLLVIDDDVFEENNLNRQLYSSPARLGQEKANVAVERLAEINPAVQAEALVTRFTRESGSQLLGQVDCVVDAVDSVNVRLELAEVCRDLQVPLVHGAIAGWYGQVATVLPGDASLEQIYRHWDGGKGVESTLGNPSFTPAAAASFEVAEVCKVLLQRPELLRHRQLCFDLLAMETTEIPLD